MAGIISCIPHTYKTQINGSLQSFEMKMQQINTIYASSYKLNDIERYIIYGQKIMQGFEVWRPLVMNSNCQKKLRYDGSSIIFLTRTTVYGYFALVLYVLGSG